MGLKGEKSMKVTLVDQSDYQAPTLDVEVREFNGTILIGAKGYGEMCSNDDSGHPVVIELYEGNFRVIAWADINQEDCTHIIDLSDARIENRKEIDQLDLTT